MGCVLVKDNRVVSMGYNGFLSGKQHVSIVRDAAKRGVSIDDTVAYITHYPCLNCYKTLASSGVKCTSDYKNDPIISDLNYINVVKID